MCWCEQIWLGSENPPRCCFIFVKFVFCVIFLSEVMLKQWDRISFRSYSPLKKRKNIGKPRHLRDDVVRFFIQISEIQIIVCGFPQFRMPRICWSICGVASDFKKQVIPNNPNSLNSSRIFRAPIPSFQRIGMDPCNPFLRTYLDSWGTNIKHFQALPGLGNYHTIISLWSMGLEYLPYLHMGSIYGLTHFQLTFVRDSSDVV